MPNALKSTCSIWHCKQQCIKFLFSPYLKEHLVMSVSLILAILESIMGLKFCVFMMSSGVEQIFLHWLGIHVSVLQKCLIKCNFHLFIICLITVNIWRSWLWIFYHIYQKSIPETYVLYLINSQSTLHGLIFRLHLFIHPISQ